MVRAFLAVAACAVASPAMASAPNSFGHESAELRLDGIDFDTAEGQNRLAIRLDNVAHTICGDRLASVHLATAKKARECRADVIADVRSQISQQLAKKSQTAQFASSR
ncbi:UrcA family protein [Altericroceibacterium endophyticum]|nr:UrcA family protein [Altericroceibacterium endophyticum]